MSDFHSPVLAEPEQEQHEQQEKYGRELGLAMIAPAKIRIFPTAVMVDLEDVYTKDGAVAFPPRRTVVSNTELDDGPHRVTDDGTSYKTPSDEADEKPKISLAHFSYIAPSFDRPWRSNQPRNLSTSRENNKPPARQSTHRFADVFSASELRRLEKCISCDMRWMVQKSAYQKMIHVQSCAKKKALADETICVLLRKEIDSYDGTSLPNKGGKGEQAKATTDAQAPTYLKGIVTYATARRMKQRLDVPETVNTVSQSRHPILHRAKAVIGPTPNIGHVDDRRPDSHTKAVDVCEMDDAVLSPTQPFGRSALAQAWKASSKLFDCDGGCDERSADNKDGRFGAPTNTQSFAPIMPLSTGGD
ncbi:hypothetical protein DXG01_007130 [Tephrocybe rancida]|nr:hypothetical protein DXG01_007130 [Tephrocybe rancida]